MSKSRWAEIKSDQWPPIFFIFTTIRKVLLACIFNIGFFFFLMATPEAHESSWARDPIRALAATCATVAATADPLTHCTGLGVEPPPL